MIRIPSSADRVPEHTSQEVNERIRSCTESKVSYYAKHPEAIDHRLAELDREWDIERVLEANAASLALGGALLSLFVDRRFAIVPAVVAGFLLQHALQGWCPPVPIVRRLGFRTPQEIEAERYALKVLRGDFDNVPQENTDGREALEATGRFASDV